MAETDHPPPPRRHDHGDPSPVPATQSQTQSRILLAEDNPIEAATLRSILEKHGYAVQIAPDGDQAFKIFENSACDMVITDVTMPGISGFQLCRRVKAHTAKQRIPVILLTGLNDPMDILQGLECGADNYLTKPCRADVLIRRVRDIFSNRDRQAVSKLRVGAEVMFLGKSYTINSDREQILDLLLATCEDVIRSNSDLRASQRALEEAKVQLEQYARRMEEQARSSEDKYRRLMEQANDAIFILDQGGSVLEVNRRAEELLGLRSGDIVHRSFVDFVPDEEREIERAQFHKLLAEGSVRRNNAHVRRADGTLVCVDSSASLADIGEAQVVLAIIHDATERERLEQQFRQAQKLEAIGRLAGGVAHDFNNLLTVIIGYGQILQDGLPKNDPNRELVGEMIVAGDRATSLTRQLLAFGRQQMVAPQVLDLRAVLADTEKMLRRLIGEDIELAVASAADLGPIKADSGQLGQVLMNLAVNARDAMPSGGQLTIETCNVEITEDFTRTHAEVQPGPYVLLAVSDTGCGMTPEVNARVWEPFFTTKAPGRGTGLGLAVVHGIVKQAGGHLDVYSEMGTGTTFKLYLPRVNEKPATKKPATAEDVFPHGTETILLVEDEDVLRALARVVLEGCGYTVLEARGGQEAQSLAALHEKRINLLLTDVVMPRMGGRELAERLTRQHPHLRVLYLSGYTDDAVMRHGILEHQVAFLQKPFSPGALARKVREVLDQH